MKAAHTPLKRTSNPTQQSAVIALRLGPSSGFCCTHAALGDQLLHTDLQQANKRTGDNFVKVGHSCAAYFLIAATINNLCPPLISSSLVEWSTLAWITAPATTWTLPPPLACTDSHCGTSIPFAQGRLMALFSTMASKCLTWYWGHPATSWSSGKLLQRKATHQPLISSSSTWLSWTPTSA